MDPELPAVLLMGGGEGMGPVKKTARALGEALFDKTLEKPIGQLVIICGRNESLATTLKSLDWKIPVKVSINILITRKHAFYKGELFKNLKLVVCVGQRF